MKCATNSITEFSSSSVVQKPPYASMCFPLSSASSCASTRYFFLLLGTTRSIRSSHADSKCKEKTFTVYEVQDDVALAQGSMERQPQFMPHKGAHVLHSAECGNDVSLAHRSIGLQPELDPQKG